MKRIYLTMVDSRSTGSSIRLVSDIHTRSMQESDRDASTQPTGDQVGRMGRAGCGDVYIWYDGAKESLVYQWCRLSCASMLVSLMSG